MGWITKYGSFWGQLPQTTGNVYWVSPGATYVVEGRTYSASDDNDGLSPERAMRTLDAAINKTTANAGDVIVMLPGAHTGSTVVALDVAGVTITGLPRGSLSSKGDHGSGVLRHAASLTTDGARTALTITAANSEVCYLHIIPVTAQAGIDIAGANINLHDLTFDMATPAESTSTFGISVTGAVSLLRVANCYVSSDGSQGGWFDDSAGTATITLTDSVIENCTVQSAGTSAWADVIVVASGATNLVIRDCDFIAISGALMTDVIDITGNTADGGVQVARCIVSVGCDGVQATATSDIQVCNNYIMTIEGGTGGTLVS